MILMTHRQWFYKGDEGRIFETGEEIPEGWFDRPNATEWYCKPEQPVMKLMPVMESGEVTKPASDDAPEVFYCDECDKEYKEKFWYDKHMLEKHGAE